MKRAKLELMVGLFVLMGLAALAWLSVKLARMELMTGDNLPLYASFSSIAGLKSGANVEIAGVAVGRVQKITLDREEYEARVLMMIDSGVAIQEDSIASVRTKGLIGDRYISISPGGSERLLKANETIIETEPSINFEELISQFVHGTIQ